MTIQTDNTQLTPAENRRKAGEALNRATGVNPASPLYQHLVLTGIYHTLAAIATCMEPPPPPALPGLPPGWLLDTEQSQGGGHKWRYILTPPDDLHGQIVSQYRWEQAATAIAEGVRHAAIAGASQNGNGDGNAAS